MTNKLFHNILDYFEILFLVGKKDNKYDILHFGDEIKRHTYKTSYVTVCLSLESGTKKPRKKFTFLLN